MEALSSVQHDTHLLDLTDDILIQIMTALGLSKALDSSHLRRFRSVFSFALCNRRLFHLMTSHIESLRNSSSKSIFSPAIYHPTHSLSHLRTLVPHLRNLNSMVLSGCTASLVEYVHKDAPLTELFVRTSPNVFASITKLPATLRDLTVSMPSGTTMKLLASAPPKLHLPKLRSATINDVGARQLPMLRSFLRHHGKQFRFLSLSFRPADLSQREKRCDDIAKFLNFIRQLSGDLLDFCPHVSGLCLLLSKCSMDRSVPVQNIMKYAKIVSEYRRTQLLKQVPATNPSSLLVSKGSLIDAKTAEDMGLDMDKVTFHVDETVVEGNTTDDDADTGSEQPSKGLRWDSMSKEEKLDMDVVHELVRFIQCDVKPDGNNALKPRPISEYMETRVELPGYLSTLFLEADPGCLRAWVDAASPLMDIFVNVTIDSAYELLLVPHAMSRENPDFETLSVPSQLGLRVKNDFCRPRDLLESMNLPRTSKINIQALNIPDRPIVNRFQFEPEYRRRFLQMLSSMHGPEGLGVVCSYYSFEQRLIMTDPTSGAVDSGVADDDDDGISGGEDAVDVQLRFLNWMRHSNDLLSRMNSSHKTPDEVMSEFLQTVLSALHNSKLKYLTLSYEFVSWGCKQAHLLVPVLKAMPTSIVELQFKMPTLPYGADPSTNAIQKVTHEFVAGLAVFARLLTVRNENESELPASKTEGSGDDSDDDSEYAVDGEFVRGLTLPYLMQVTVDKLGKKVDWGPHGRRKQELIDGAVGALEELGEVRPWLDVETVLSVLELWRR